MHLLLFAVGISDALTSLRVYLYGIFYVLQCNPFFHMFYSNSIILSCATLATFESKLNYPALNCVGPHRVFILQIALVYYLVVDTSGFARLADRAVLGDTLVLLNILQK